MAVQAAVVAPHHVRLAVLQVAHTADAGAGHEVQDAQGTSCWMASLRLAV